MEGSVTLCCKKEYTFCYHQSLMGKVMKEVYGFFRELESLESLLVHMHMPLTHAAAIHGFLGR